MSLPLLSALAANMSAHIEASARDLQFAQQAIFNQQHFEVKGDLIVFRETHKLFNQVRAVLKKVKDAGQSAISTLHGYAGNVRTMDDRAVFSYVMVNFLGLRQNVHIKMIERLYDACARHILPEHFARIFSAEIDSSSEEPDVDHRGTGDFSIGAERTTCA